MKNSSQTEKNQNLFDCKQCLLTMPAYFDQNLDRNDKKSFEQHIEKCNNCLTKFNQLKQLSETIDSVQDILLPHEITRKMGSLLSKNKAKRLIAKPKSNLFIKRKIIIYQAINSLLILSVLAITYGFLVLYTTSYNKDRGNIRGETKSFVVTTITSRPPLDLIKSNKIKQSDEPGVESLIENNNNPESFTNLPQPEVKVTNFAYNHSDISDLVEKKIVLDFLENYTASQIEILNKKFLNKIINQARSLGENPNEVKACLDVALGVRKGFALPAYIEKARLDNKEVWIFILACNKNNEEQLSTVIVVAVGLKEKKIVYID